MRQKLQEKNEKIETSKFMRNQMNQSKSEMLNSKFNSVSLKSAQQNHQKNIWAKQLYFEKKYEVKLKKSQNTLESLESLKQQEIERRQESANQKL